MNKTALVIMAAGMGSRYGGGIKQLEHVGVSGEIIMEYSIYDAIAAGFDKVVFITRKELEEEFKKIIKPSVAEQVEVEYVFQELENLPEGFTVPEGRTKPWGTGHAILSCLGAVKEPFAVINADDYYGKEAFVKIHDFLANAESNPDCLPVSMVGFVLENTLSENGQVTRGVCRVDENHMLAHIEENFGIEKQGDVAVGKNGAGEPVELPLSTPVSMNLWGFTPEFLDTLEERFIKFLGGIAGNETKAEFLLPEVVGSLLKENKAKCTVLTSNDRWFGVTYKEDKDLVVRSFRELYEKGLYPEQLFR
ncbi:MAG: nucleotidyltransferase [Lachnospiraceae bacterium]|nr:nucleotidyltransferase [Lachnospiraceae bacterium]